MEPIQPDPWQGVTPQEAFRAASSHRLWVRNTVPSPGRTTGQHQAAKVQCKADTQRAEGKANNGTPSQVAVEALGKHQACSAARGKHEQLLQWKKEKQCAGEVTKCATPIGQQATQEAAFL